MATEQCCGTCMHHKRIYNEGVDKIYSCDNDGSDNYSYETDYYDTCDDWDERCMG